ncbi:MAG: EamA/RhaT family transporter, partial [Meiothermus sp.]
ITAGIVAGVLYLGVVSTAVAFTFWVYAVARAGSVLSGIAFFAQPAVGALLGWALLGESLGLGFALGAALLVARPK